MKKIFKRLLSVMLALVMVVGMIPFSNLTITQAATSYTGTIYFDNSDSNWSSVYVYTMVDKQFHSVTSIDASGYYYLDIENWGGTDVFFTSSNDWNAIKSSHYTRSETKELGAIIDKISKATGDAGVIDNMNVYSVSVSEYTAGGTTVTPTPTVTPTEGTTRIYLDTRNYMPSGWGEAYLYRWDPNTDNSGKTVEMNSVEENGETVKGLFYYDVPTGYQMIFKPNKDNWSGKTGNQSMPTDGKNIFICKTFNKMTTGEWGSYGTTDTSNNFPSNVTGKVTFFDLYTDTEINKNQNPENDPEYYHLDTWKYSDNSAFKVNNYSFTSIGRAFSNNVNQKIKAYWSSVKTSDNKSVSPLYFGNFQPFYKITGDNENKDMGKEDPWWTDNNSFKKSDSWSANRTGYMNAVYGSATHDVSSFSYFLNRSVDVGSNGNPAEYGAVVKGIVGNELVNGNIVAKGTTTVLPQFNKTFYDNNPTIGKYYDTMEFPFVIRALDTSDDGIPDANYYQFDSGVSGSPNRDIVRLSADGKSLIYYDGTVEKNQIVEGLTAEGNRTPGFFPFNDPDDSTGNVYYGSGNKLNYGFGMKLEIEFTIDSDGMVKDLKGNKIPAIFEFSGDDDVWIYVDNKLALDLGGSHGVARGKLDFSKKKAIVQYVKGLNDTYDLSQILEKEDRFENEDYVNRVAAGASVSKNASLDINGANVTDFEIDMNDSAKIHKLTIFYEERGMFESNFKATFNLEQPTVLKTTNTVDVTAVNPGLQDAAKAAAANETFTYTVKDEKGEAVDGKIYTDNSGESKIYEDTVSLIDGGTATFTKQFDRGAVLGLSQAENSKFNTSWTISELSDSGLGKAISASYQTGKNALGVDDGRVKNGDGTETEASDFKLENADDGADDSVPAKVQIDYLQSPKTGGIAVLKTVEDNVQTTDHLFEFTVYFSNVFGGGSEKSTYNFVYDVYNYAGKNGESSTIVRKDATAENGVISLKANQFALIDGIPIDTKYEIVENENVGYEVSGLDVKTHRNNDKDVTGNKNTGTVTGTVVEDTESNVDMFVYTNAAEKLEDSFLIEVGKENILNVIPTADKDGTLSGDSKTLSGDLKKISEKWNNSTVTSKGFVFVKNDGTLCVDGDGKPLTEIAVEGVTYKVDEDTESGYPVIKVNPNVEITKDTQEIQLKYQLVELDGEGKVKYNTVDDPDSDNPNDTITELASITGVITMTNYLYKANDDVYVLDYGLDVDLAEKTGYGLFENDKLANSSLTGTTSTYWNTAAGKISSTASADTATAQNKAAAGIYGTITPNDETEKYLTDAVNEKNVQNLKIKYSLDKFLNGEDNFNYGVMIQKGDAEEGQTSNRFRLNVTSNISIFPANVVYYEDNFNSDIKSADSTAKIIYSGNAATADTSPTLTQSNGQTEQYGYDEAYTSGTGDSAGSSTKLTADGYNTKAVFTFTGKGFDIIARTNDETAGIFCIIEKVNENGSLEIVNTVGVDTYYANGDLYQIPVIHADVEYGTYQVTLGIKKANNGNNVVYLDGIRIYNPLGTLTDEEKGAYIDNEEGATFVKVSDLILGDGVITETGIIDENGENVIKGQSIQGSTVALLQEGMNNKAFEAIGYSRVENTQDNGATSAYSVLTYLNAGPNNEVYLDDEGIFAFIANGTPGDQATIQIEAKLLNTNPTSDAEASGGELELSILNVDEDGYADVVELDDPLVVDSSTAMYYEIPVEKCIKLADGKYLVAIQGDYDQKNKLCVSLSNMKYKGYTISNPLNDETAVNSYIETFTDSDCAFKEIIDGTQTPVGSLNLIRKTWYEDVYSIVLNKDVFGDDTTPEFTMYYVAASGAKTPITVTTVEISSTEYSLTFKSPNAVGEFPVELHYVLADGTDSADYFATTMSVRRK